MKKAWNSGPASNSNADDARRFTATPLSLLVVSAKWIIKLCPETFQKSKKDCKTSVYNVKNGIPSKEICITRKGNFHKILEPIGASFRNSKLFQISKAERPLDRMIDRRNALSTAVEIVHSNNEVVPGRRSSCVRLSINRFNPESKILANSSPLEAYNNSRKELKSERSTSRFPESSVKLWKEECNRIKNELNQALVAFQCNQKNNSKSSIFSINTSKTFCL